MNKAAIVTTTIHVPRLLKLIHACDTEIHSFVALDNKTPKEAVSFCESLSRPNAGNVCHVYDVNMQQELGYACSELIGFNTIGRRNIATLEALRWGADVIIFYDDDNAPLSSKYVGSFRDVLARSYCGLSASGKGWFDVGKLMFPRVVQRGIPQTTTAKVVDEIGHVVAAKVGVAQGICLGNPDTSAVDRISQQPTIHTVSELLRTGIVVNPETTRTVFNTQNTAVIRDLVPAMLLCPQFKRYDDIVASLICQRIMRNLGYVVHFGQPFAWQERNPHNLVRDLEDEMWGMKNIEALVEVLEYGCGFWVPSGNDVHASVIERVREIYDTLDKCSILVQGVSKLSEAWAKDCHRVMSK